MDYLGPAGAVPVDRARGVLHWLQLRLRLEFLRRISTTCGCSPETRLSARAPSVVETMSGNDASRGCVLTASYSYLTPFLWQADTSSPNLRALQDPDHCSGAD